MGGKEYCGNGGNVYCAKYLSNGIGLELVAGCHYGRDLCIARCPEIRLAGEEDTKVVPGQCPMRPRLCRVRNANRMGYGLTAGNTPSRMCFWYERLLVMSGSDIGRICRFVLDCCELNQLMLQFKQKLELKCN